LKHSLKLEELKRPDNNKKKNIKKKRKISH